MGFSHSPSGFVHNGVGPDGSGISTPEQAEGFRDALDIVPDRQFMIGPDTGPRTFMDCCDRGQDAALALFGDSTFVDSRGLGVQLGEFLKVRYPASRIELRRAAQNMQSIPLTVVQAGASGRRHINYAAGCTYGPAMQASMFREPFTGVNVVSFECEISIPASKLNGSGWPTADLVMMGIGSSGNRTRFYIAANGYMILGVEATGGAALNLVVSTVPLPAITADLPVRYRVDFTADNGASKRIGRFYTSIDLGITWTELGTADNVRANVTFNTAEQFFWLATPIVDGVQSGTTDIKYYHAQILLGTKRDPIIPNRIDLWGYGAGQITGIADLGGSHTIYIDDCSQNGASVENISTGFFNGSAAGSFPIEAYRCYLDHAPVFFILNTGHNDAKLAFPLREVGLESAITNILARSALKPVVVHTTQNPEPDSYADGGLARQHNQSMQQDMKMVAAKKGRGLMDPWTAFKIANNPAYADSSVHPTSPAGYNFWGRVAWSCMLSGRNDEYDPFP